MCYFLGFDLYIPLKKKQMIEREGWWRGGLGGLKEQRKGKLLKLLSMNCGSNK